jgi:hypothetical protein
MLHIYLCRNAAALAAAHRGHPLCILQQLLFTYAVDLACSIKSQPGYQLVSVLLFVVAAAAAAVQAIWDVQVTAKDAKVTLELLGCLAALLAYHPSSSCEAGAKQRISNGLDQLAGAAAAAATPAAAAAAAAAGINACIEVQVCCSSCKAQSSAFDSNCWANLLPHQG